MCLNYAAVVTLGAVVGNGTTPSKVERIFTIVWYTPMPL